MAFFASVNGLQIVSGSLMVPLIGAWTADLTLATSQAVAGSATVAIGNLTLIGYVYRSDSYGGQVRARLVGGAGGWRKPIPSQGYGTGSGVSLSTVLRDAARSCGETVNVARDTTIGNAYVRAAFNSSVAGDVLWQMVSQGFIPAWYVAPNGMTMTQSWPASVVSTPFTVTDQKPDEGSVEIATEDYASWMPGCSFSAPQLSGTYTSAGVHYVWTGDGKFRFEVLTSTGAGDRMLGPIQQVIQKEIAPTRYYGRYEYTVSAPTTTTIDGSPVDPSQGLPDVLDVPLTGDSISAYAPAAGATCHIMFLNGLPTKPICVWTDQTPTSVGLASGTTPVAKIGDTVQSVVSGSLSILPGSTAGNSGGLITGVLIVQGITPISGTITTGSSVVSAAQ
jgi:hypothetical protein